MKGKKKIFYLKLSCPGKNQVQVLIVVRVQTSSHLTKKMNRETQHYC